MTKALLAIIAATLLVGVGAMLKKNYDDTPRYAGDTYIAMQVAEEIERRGLGPESASFVGLDFHALCTQERRNFKLQTRCSGSSEGLAVGEEDGLFESAEFQGRFAQSFEESGAGVAEEGIFQSEEFQERFAQSMEPEDVAAEAAARAVLAGETPASQGSGTDPGDGITVQDKIFCYVPKMRATGEVESLTIDPGTESAAVILAGHGLLKGRLVSAPDAASKYHTYVAEFPPQAAIGRGYVTVQLHRDVAEDAWTVEAGLMEGKQDKQRLVKVLDWIPLSCGKATLDDADKG